MISVEREQSVSDSAGKVAGHADQHCVYQNVLADAFCPNGAASERRKATIWPAVRSEGPVKKANTLLKLILQSHIQGKPYTCKQ